MKDIFIILFPHIQTKKTPNHKNPMSYVLPKCLVNQILQALQAGVSAVCSSFCLQMPGIDCCAFEAFNGI